MIARVCSRARGTASDPDDRGLREAPSGPSRRSSISVAETDWSWRFLIHYRPGGKILARCRDRACHGPWRHDRKSAKRGPCRSARRGFLASAFTPNAALEAVLHKRPHPPVFSAHHRPRFIDPPQWIGLFAGEQALMALEATTEARAVQALVANYNRISTGLAEAPETWRPRFARCKDDTFDALEWSTAFLLATARPKALAPRSPRPCQNRRHHRPDPGHGGRAFPARRRRRRCYRQSRHHRSTSRRLAAEPLLLSTQESRVVLVTFTIELLAW